MNEPFREPLRCRPPAVATCQLKTEQVCVTRWDFTPGAETGWHRFWRLRTTRIGGSARWIDSGPRTPPGKRSATGWRNRCNNSCSR